MQAAGVQWVSLCVMILQETFASTRLFADYQRTAADDELAGIIAKIHARGMQVLFKPIIECWDSAWRGRIRFPEGDQQIQGIQVDYWGRWFESNTRAMVHYARMAEEHGVKAFTVAQELDGAEMQHEHWIRLIGAVRDVYHGFVTCNTTYGVIRNTFGTNREKWFTHCDALGMSYYPTGIGKAEPSLAELTEHMRRDLADGRQLSAGLGIPIYWAECGCRSARGAANVPWDYASPWPYDGETQARFFEAMLATFWDEPWWAGFQYWKWDEHQARPHYQQPGGDAGFTIQGKPAEKVMRDWCRREHP
jgi:hypothetical protein